MSEQPTEHAHTEGAAIVTEQQTVNETPTPEVLAQMRKLKVDMTISKHVASALGFGFIPVPLVDFVAVTGVQLDMVYRLCRIYEVDFSTQAVRAVIASLVGAGLPLQPLLTSGIKMIPGIGTAAGFFAAPALAGATTYAVGRVFTEHFETGGTLLTFDANKMKAHFEQALAEGKNVVAGLRKS
jgi:uncharacterized protein (DUF697 family)